jgi:branched-chain amino acid transport system permease protein
MNRTATILPLLLVLGFGIAFPSWAGSYTLIVGLLLCQWIALTASWTLCGGLAGYISLGHVVFFGIGGYTSVLLWQVVPLWIAVPAGGLAAGLFALLIGAPVLRVRGPYFVILTLGIAELVKYLVLLSEKELGKSSRLIFGVPSNETLYWALLALATLAIVILLIVRETRLGHGLIALRDDETAAATVGVPVARYKLAAFTLSAIIPGMVGALMVLRSAYFDVTQLFNAEISFAIVTMAIIGGRDDPRGAVLGAGLLLLISEFLWARAPQIYLILLGVLLIGFVLFLPRGLAGLLSRRGKAS